MELPDLPAGVTRVDAPTPHYLVRTEACEADVYDLGAQLARWAPAGEPDVIWLSPRATFTPGKAIRGGVPVCYPWFGPGADGAPAHGVARTAVWRSLGAETGTDGLSLGYALDPQLLPPEHREHLPAGAQAELRITVGETARVAFTLTAGPEPVEAEVALHTYLGVSDVEAVTVTGLEGVGFLDQPTGERGCEDAPLRPAGEIDRLYDASRVVTVADAERMVTVEPAGAAQTVVWTPGPAKAETLADLGDAYRGFLCVETLAARDRRLRLAPGESATVATTVAVRRR